MTDGTGEPEYWINDYDFYGGDKTVTVTGEKTDHVHTFGSYLITVQPTKDAPGVRTEYCAECGEIMAQTEVVYMPGDVNGDSLVTIRDLGSLKAYLAGDSDDKYAGVNCEVTGDGLITITDIAKLKQILA